MMMMVMMMMSAVIFSRSHQLSISCYKFINPGGMKDLVDPRIRIVGNELGLIIGAITRGIGNWEGHY